MIVIMMCEKCLSCRAVPIGVVSYMDIDGYRYKRDVLFYHDLELPDGFIPKNQGKTSKMQHPSIENYEPHDFSFIFINSLL